MNIIVASFRRSTRIKRYPVQEAVVFAAITAVRFSSLSLSLSLCVCVFYLSLKILIIFPVPCSLSWLALLRFPCSLALSLSLSLSLPLTSPLILIDSFPPFQLFTQISSIRPLLSCFYSILFSSCSSLSSPTYLHSSRDIRSVLWPHSSNSTAISSVAPERWKSLR